MLWFQQPPGQQIWGQKIIHEGMADGNFIGFIYDRKSYILSAGNQFNSLGLYWTMSKLFLLLLFFTGINANNCSLHEKDRF